MPHNTNAPPQKDTKEERVLNEIDAKVENEEKLDDVIEARKSGEKTLHDIVPFDCECDDKACDESILMSTEEYKHVHSKTNRFVVLPGHVQLDIEEVITTFNTYVIVAKLFPLMDNAGTA